MTKPDGVPPDTNHHPWGTWEELLLAFAVNRHGTASWDSIASELQKRTSDPNLCLTPHNCRSKYLDLKRRFILNNPDFHASDDKSNVDESLPLLEELRKLRVAELRREVQRYDLNIESLELKMKRMEEEREKGARRHKGEADLENDAEEKRDCETAAAAELEKDQLSVNESNSTDPGAEKVRTGEQPAIAGAEEVRKDRTEEPAELAPGPDQKSDSCNGSSNSIEEPERKAKKSEAEGESESEGGGAEAMKENSDVQSSASRSRKEEGSDKVRRESRSGDEREHEDQSRAVKALPAESQPLVDLLQTIRTPMLGFIFERRLRSQETSKYQKLILQHMDLETIDTRLKQGFYSPSTTKFFRDLLLIVNNALVFFSSNSAEAAAALQIRRLVSNHISHPKSKSHSSSGLSLPKAKREEEAEEASPSLVLKPTVPLIVCRKRSSIAAKKKENELADDKDKDKEKETKQQQLSGDEEEPKITKKRSRDRFTKKTGKSNGKQTSAGKQQQQGKGGSEAKGDSKKGQSTSDSKKRGAANFLNRIKQGSSSSNNNGVLLDALKNTPLTTVKKTENAKRGEKKEAAAATRSSTEARQTKEKEKRNVGRPPKRGAAAPKRGRDKGEAEAASKQPKKRSRKL